MTILAGRRRSAISTSLALAALLACFALMADAALGACRGADVEPTSAKTLRQARTATVCLLSEVRAERGRAPLQSDRRLSRAALRHSRDMARSNRLGAKGSDGSFQGERAQRTGYEGRLAGELYASSSRDGDSLTPRVVVDALAKRRRLRRIIDSRRARDAGVGIVEGSAFKGVAGGSTYTITLGKP